MKVNELKGQTAHLTNLNNINVIMGRNGAGKSRFLRDIEEMTSRNNQRFYVRYVSPERAGTFKRNGSVITNMTSNPNWLRESRATNQSSDFKAASAMLFREAETLYLRRLASTPEIRLNQTRNFETDRLSKVNQLLTNISLEMGKTDLEFRSLADGQVIRPEEISSGESEAVALSTEILYFFDTIEPSKFNLLLLDEPDVHLHPDLQARLGKLIISMLDEFKNQAESIAVCLSTHSSPLVCSLADSPYVSIGTKSFAVDAVELKPISAELRKVAPFFGHPLSLSLSEDVALILEGEDDERVWQQAARTSKGRIKVFPVLAGSVDQQAELESFCVDLLGTLYDNPVAFSLRDGDGVVDQPLEHCFPIKRYRLNCYSIENTIVTDPCLAVMRTTWPDFIAAVTKWVEENHDHPDSILIKELAESNDRLRHKKIKRIRQLVCAVLECKKPWEVVVGQAIGALMSKDLTNSNMLVDFLGAEMVSDIIFRNAA
ncbi:AAA family ATPase [Rhodoplanes sp. TEM]|uniref:AAA family ATPase n=1 Tax=Rhodoplanes tepidamans TaxID=200616 RepID=A0ABT5JEU7_RHOTP|nr:MULTISPECIES: AAA family ATPase [Rhodoplanes]MDC7788221.1 AAA family ATPase [Rhodoplanes tepidamans]MDC7982974.1 AAA family ATPase [Rhodoplanes sp. TEM]MDQ0355911.1 ABC-type branched-subunit amino acid transport system ATPase component [Rhodoplanes tepidamans]